MIRTDDGDLEPTELDKLERVSSSPAYNPNRPSSPAYDPNRPPSDFGAYEEKMGEPQHLTQSPAYVSSEQTPLKEYESDPWKTEKNVVTDSDSDSEEEEKPPIIIHHGEHDSSDLKILANVDDLEKDIEDMAEHDKQIKLI